MHRCLGDNCKQVHKTTHAQADSFLDNGYNCSIRCSLSNRQRTVKGEISTNCGRHPCGVVGGDEKESLKSETVKYDHEFQGTRTRERLR
jgi:hypothetical protein